MGTEIIDRVSQYIDALAANLGVAASHVYETMVRQMVVEGAVYSIFLSSLLAALTVLGIKLIKLTVAKKDKIYRDDWEAFVYIGWVVGGIAYIILLIASIVIVPESVMKIYNPEYFVIRDLLSIVKGAS
ncbi:hypothetical protein M5X06_12725 [Paenibacillus alvei]|uniref:Uncharacterized protein n=2 Tax=Paenibacillus alvei TaxID=44250 RepID=A0ABT4GUM7_PAEAL|nr:hypothetical protein [Paenibacillus alvei]MCY9532939.1 hypothetical protein [Paenibacillus alvei]MCY9760384.1 hypothetical protein [Paenibacillus alvei]MCY9767676.1 hypothetical protein [Paenibacillus alvei]